MRRVPLSALLGPRHLTPGAYALTLGAPHTDLRPITVTFWILRA
jgi:hypothetical protein